MNRSSAPRLFPLLRLLLCTLLCTPVLLAQQGHLVISQVYGGGGNSGATYRYDFVELYNGSATQIDLSTYSLQYASSTGPSGGGAWATAALSGTVGAHQYFLIRACIGNNTSTATDLPTPDFSLPNYNDSTKCAPAISATSGKIALVSNATALAGPFGTTAGLGGTSCPTVNTAAIVDFVGFGTAATCFEGTGPTPTLSATTSAIRDSGNDDTGDNKADFTAVTPNPRNSATNAGSTTGSLALTSATANPASVTAGNTTVLTAVISGGSAAVNLSVTADLSQIGGSSTQALTLSTTANTYTYTATVGASVAANTYQLPITVKDASTGSTASGTVNVTVQAAVTTTPIATLQSNRSTYVGTTVTTTGIVTVVTNAGFFLQTASSTPGSTGVAEGLYVYTGTGKVPTTAVVGNSLQVSGSLSLYPAATASHTPALELGSPAVTVLATGQAVPAPIALSAASLTPTGGLYQLTKYEGMRVSVPSLTATSGTDGNLTENTETVTSTGEFYAVMTGVARPFREPGMDFRDFPPATCPTVTNCTSTATQLGVPRPANLVLFDDNPERLLVESSLGGGNPVDLSAGAVLTNVTGVIDFSYSTDTPYGDPARLILEPGTVTATNYTPGISVVPLTPATAGQFTVAAFNIERFFNTNAADDLYFNAGTGAVAKSGAVDVTAAAYARRLQKVSLAIRTVLNDPDIISVEETENLSVLKDIAAQIDADTTTGTKPGYVAYGSDSVTTFSDDSSGISIGFLVKPSTVDVVNFQQVGATSTFTNSSGSPETLNDRPSDVLHAGIKRGTGVADYPITVISNHLKALTGVNSLAPDTRTKKELQAEMLANLIQGYQKNGEHVVAVGDMNAFQFSDGYTDTLGTITGRITDPTSVVQPGMAIVSPAATDLVTLLPANQQQSYTEYGDAQVLDHIIVTADIVGSTTLAYAHLDADFPLVDYNDPTTPARVSDHDAALAYLALPAPVISATLTGTGSFPQEPIGVASQAQTFTLTNTGQAPLTITSLATTGDFSETSNCGTMLAISSSCTVAVVFKPTAAGTRAGTLTLSSNATVSADALTGTGLTPDFSLSDSNGATTSAVTVPAGQSTTVTLTLKPVNGLTGSVTLTCAAVGTAPAGVACSPASPVTLSATASTSALVTLTTTARTRIAGLGTLPGGRTLRLASMLALLAGLLGLGTLRRARGLVRLASWAVLLLAAAGTLAGCSNNAANNTNPNGTPAGTYSYTVTASSGTLTHTQIITLTVQ